MECQEPPRAEWRGPVAGGAIAGVVVVGGGGGGDGAAAAAASTSYPALTRQNLRAHNGVQDYACATTHADVYAAGAEGDGDYDVASVAATESASAAAGAAAAWVDEEDYELFLQWEREQRAAAARADVAASAPAATLVVAAQQRQWRAPARPVALTNDHDYERARAHRPRFRARYGPPGLVCADVDEDDERAASAAGAAVPLSELPYDEMMAALAKKYEPRSVHERAGDYIARLLDNINNAVLPASEPARHTTTAPAAGGTASSSATTAAARVNAARLDQATHLELGADLGYACVRDALAGGAPLRHLAKCGLTAADFAREQLYVSELQRYGLTLSDVVDVLRLPWSELRTTLRMSRVHLVREPNWFDTRTLADCAARQGANLVRDLGFSLHDVYRLRCADIELAQLGIDVDALVALGMRRDDFVQLPWYPETLCNALGLTKRHLLGALALERKHHRYLMRTRSGWTEQLFRGKLGYSEAEMRQFVLPSKRRATQAGDARRPVAHYAAGGAAAAGLQSGPGAVQPLSAGRRRPVEQAAARPSAPAAAYAIANRAEPGDGGGGRREMTARPRPAAAGVAASGGGGSGPPSSSPAPQQCTTAGTDFEFADLEPLEVAATAADSAADAARERARAPALRFV